VKVKSWTGFTQVQAKSNKTDLLHALQLMSLNHSISHGHEVNQWVVFLAEGWFLCWDSDNFGFVPLTFKP
jgi:hypothetical protein